MIDYDELKDVIHADKRIKEIIMDLIQQYYESQEELTQQEPKYNVGDEVWIRQFYNCKSFVIHTINQHEDTVWYSNVGGDISTREQYLYPTKAALIEAQIAYWSNLREPIKFPTRMPII